MAKSKKNRQQDFQKVKLKVGKTLKKADNVTNASFKTRAIQISQKLKSGAGSQPSTRKKQNITDLFSQCRHYSTSVRLEAVNGLKELITTNPELVKSHLSDIIEKSAELLTDKDSMVRQGTIRVFKLFLPMISEKQISSFVPLLTAHLCCAMTHIYDDIQVDSLAVLDLLLDNYPRLMIYKSSQVLFNFIEQISRQQGHGQTKRSLSTNPNSATSSVKWRSSVLSRLQKFLAAILKFHGESSNNKKTTETVEASADDFEMSVTFTPDEVISVQPFPSYIRKQWEMPGFSISSSAAIGTDNNGVILNGRFPEFANTLVPLMLECWVESAPTREKGRSAGGNLLSGDNVGMMYNILQVTQLLWECIDTLPTDEDADIVNQGRYLKDFEQHFMANFPYSVNTRVSKKEKKQHTVNIQVPAETLNLSICDIMTHFIGGGSTNRGQSHDPVWLPMVTKYLNDFLSGKYGKSGVGQSARTVMKILNRFLARGFVNDALLSIVDEVFKRFHAANIASAEKKLYLQFFADIILTDDMFFISPELRNRFLQSLPDLLPMCSKENPKMASLLINTMKKAACQKCTAYLDIELFASVGQQWYDPEQGVIACLPSEDQRSLIGLLYTVPDIGLELTKRLIGLARCTGISNELVSFMIQVLQNRFLHCDQSPEVTTLHIGFLTNLVFGLTKKELDRLRAGNNDATCAVPGGFTIVNNYLSEIEDTSAADRHSFIVEVVGDAVQQFHNTDQVVEVIFQFIEKTLQCSAVIPLQLAFGICKFAESLVNIPVAVNSLLINLSISLVSHLIAWDQSTNQNAVKGMLVLGCSLVLKMSDGLERLLIMASDTVKKGPSMEMLNVTMKLVTLFLTEGRQQCMKCKPDCMQILSDFNITLESYLREHKGLVSKDTEKLVINFSYLVSCMN